MNSTITSLYKRIVSHLLGLVFLQLTLSGCSGMSVATKSGKVIVQKPKPHCVLINDVEKCVEERLIQEDKAL